MESFMANSFNLYTKITLAPHITGMKEFKKTIIKSLVTLPKPSKHIQPQASFHYLALIPPTEKKKNPARSCKHCSLKEKKVRRDTNA